MINLCFNMEKIKNPIFIPKSFKEIKEDGSRILYCNQLIQERDLRIIEYYDKEGQMYLVNVWGIRRKLEESKDCFVARDGDIDYKTSKKLRKDVEAEYPKGIEITFL